MRCTLSQRGRPCRMKDWSGADVPDLISVIVTTYNREDALEAVLSALSRQSDRGFEVVVADDGSRPLTAAVVERWRPLLGVPLGHVWQINTGFRATEIRNRAILICRGDYCVFLDGDCIAPADFVAAHRSSPNGDGSSPETACCFRRPSPRPCCATTCSLKAGAHLAGSGSACAAASIGWPPCCGCRSGRCASYDRASGGARAPAILRFGAPISSASTGSMLASAAGAARIPTC